MLKKAKLLEHHQLFIFLSVDLVGSTAFKQGQEGPSRPDQSAAGPGPPWFDAFAHFYNLIQPALTGRWPKTAGPAPAFWKAAGDELLFNKELTDYREAFLAVDAWRQTVGECREVIARDHPGLDLKATAWLVNVPIPNAEIQFEGLTIPDYIGPSMDTGFRLSALASPTRLVVSIGLALMVAEVLSEGTCPETGLELRGGEPIALKGVLGGAAYPVFWVDMRTDHDLAEVEDRLLARPRCAASDIVLFCRGKIAEKSSHFFAPYIDPELHPQPPPHETKFKEVHKTHKSRLESLRAQQAAASGKLAPQ